MNIHMSKRLFLAAAVLGALAVFAAVFFVAPTLRSVVAGPSASPDAPNPGHEWSEIEGHGTDGGDYWLGTTVDQALELRVNGARALRLEPDATSPNLIGGVSFNSVTTGVKGATIGGGGANLYRNQVTDDYGVVGGGRINMAGNDTGTTSDATYATVGGGEANDATGGHATVSGGSDNTASGDSATVGGGWDNTASIDSATVGGGENNTATGLVATVGGGNTNAATASNATVAGGHQNMATGGNATVGGGHYNTASAHNATVGGGYSNTAGGTESTVGGGHENIASADLATVGGGWNNEAAAYAATIAGGAPSDGGQPDTTRNRVTDDYGTVGGGGNNQAGNADPDSANTPYATVGGGYNNIASDYAATVSGGAGSSASGEHATVGGGAGNTASGWSATVGGGEGNTADNEYATVSGGRDNSAGRFASVGGGVDNVAMAYGSTVAGGQGNAADYCNFATVGGGWYNSVRGCSATVPGGEDNTASGDYSFAAGRRAKIDAAHDGSFLFADQSDFDFNSAAANEFAVRATGGSRIVTAIDGVGNPTAGVKLDPGDTAWEILSDRDAKENFVVLDAQDILNRLAGIPIAEWNYKAQDPSIRHIGPMAQDFYAAFGLSADDLYISPIDTDGVALAAIQGLYEISQEQAERIDALEARVAALEGGAAASNGSAGPLASIMPFGPLLLAGLVVGGLALVQRRRAGGRS